MKSAEGTIFYTTGDGEHDVEDAAFEVVDGVLTILSDGLPIQVYAPGEWSKAYLAD